MSVKLIKAVRKQHREKVVFVLPYRDTDDYVFLTKSTSFKGCAKLKREVFEREFKVI